MEIDSYSVSELTLKESLVLNGGGSLLTKVKKMGVWGLLAWATVEIIDNWADIKDGAVGGWTAAMNEE